MGRKNSWKKQEQETMMHLLRREDDKSKIDWGEVVREMKLDYFGFSKTKKQCRQKYEYYLKQDFGEQQNWSQKDLMDLKSAIEESGISWRILSSTLKNKSEVTIKNQFNRRLSRLAKTLSSYGKQGFKSSKGEVTAKILRNLLDFIYTVDIYIRKHNHLVNLQSRLFILREKILKYTLLGELNQEQSIQELFYSIKETVYRFKGSKCFKNRTNQQQQLSNQGFRSVCEFDQVIIEQISFQQNRVKPSTEIKEFMPTRASQYQNDSNPESLDSVLLPNDSTYHPQMFQIEKLPQITQQDLFEELLSS